MFEDFQQLDVFRPGVMDLIVHLLVSMACGLFISLVYRVTYKGPSYSYTFVNALVLLTMITSVVMLVIGNNLARAFGLVGAMSIIRFRTAVRDTLDIVFIFFALSIGLAAGTGLTGVAIVSTLLVSLVIWLLLSSGFGQRLAQRHLLQIEYAGEFQADGEIDKVISAHSRWRKMINIRNRGDGMLDVFFHIKLKRRTNPAELIRKLRSLEGVRMVNLFFDEDENSPPSTI
ncbi:MAG: DUF4956 domain-containing protein [Saprospiraceae bacterium]|nr:DUF4956 domain-containing protein [Saprospiraceae bacterium]